MSSPEQTDAAGPVNLDQIARIAKDLTTEVRGVRTDLRAVQKWRTRFAVAATGAAGLFIITVLVVAYFVHQNYETSAHLTGTQQHLATIVACTNTRNSQFVTAVNTRAQISTRQSLALEKLLSQVLKASTGTQFTQDVQAYISAADALASHPLPAYPANACT